ncbi:oxygenase MpaB family protein [Gordonia rubripertincta]|uniref:DUF2236 domain-containing protein n=1 Tax=Gordonia rubripertincta TaxID=36822 RepID=A0AAW4FZL2_GORRU|nr:oxygenase MpaB family protein [Gordonia rubripertincta]ASR05258.1 hypothetical protein GCWB2_22435 [Gordonia rubripertincta]MBM7276425.1 DUF2236 domain-containing protein [Gordonia rubripertincta]TSD95215.1 DUF2236 domain-containing protein [Gordonia rubripertincta]
MATEPITSGSSALSPQTPDDVTAEVAEFLTADRPDTEFLPSTARVSRAELDALPSAEDLDPLGIGVIAGAANVIMQLSLPAVGYGVYESRVDSGNLFKHPLKRGRTTLSYLAVAGLGSAKDRKAYRKAIGKAHAQVRSTADSPVKYNAFDPKLQLWVAACLYRGTEDVHRIFGGMTEVSDEFYQAGAVLGTTLQVPREAWPADREAFEEYWNTTVETLEIDPVIRGYLLQIARAEFLGPVVAKVLGWYFEILAIGFLPENFRRKMDVRLSPWQELFFARHNAVLRAIITRAPKPVRSFPFNLLLADVRWRMRTGRPLV